MVSELADHVAVLDYGRLVQCGETQAVLRDPAVQRVFVGTLEQQPGRVEA
jgi:ABC-type branched-subunit amino acid transport system ATPase component